MKHKFITCMLVSIGMLFLDTLPAQALLLEANTPFYEDSTTFKPNPDGTAPWLTALLAQDGSNVNLKLTANLTGTNFISLIYLNYKDINSSAPTSWTSTSSPMSISIGGDNAHKADGTGGLFDILIDLNLPGQGDTNLTGTDVIDIVFVNALVGNFNLYSTPDGATKSTHRIAAHVQSISTNPPGSTWIGDGNPGNPIPEPTTMLLFGTGLIALAGVIRKKRK